jgi:hypothetical protein
MIPEEFSKVIKDLITDLKFTFPEYGPLIDKWWKEKTNFDSIENEEEREAVFKATEESNIKILFEFCQKKLPPRFFDILYQNEDLFKIDSEFDTEFLPNIHFKNLWHSDITPKTRETIWKYLQLILFSLIGTLNNKDAFGDTAKLFEAINADEFKTKLEETLSQMQGLFDMSNNFSQTSEDEGLNSGINMENIPNAEDIQNHISGMLDGKLGQLAKEIAEETASNLNLDMENVTDMKDVFQNLIKNPTKLMGLVKNVGNKIDTKWSRRNSRTESESRIALHVVCMTLCTHRDNNVVTSPSMYRMVCMRPRFQNMCSGEFRNGCIGGMPIEAAEEN